MSIKINYSQILGRLQGSWTICFGMITAFVVLGYWIPHIWLPITGILLCLPIYIFSRQSIYASVLHCSLLGHYTVYTLLLSSAVMAGINMINSRWLIEFFPTLSNPNLPFITALVVYPVGTLIFAIATMRRKHTVYCKACKQRAGYSIKETLERNMFHHELRHVLRLMLGINMFLTALCGIYYFTFYINVNINTADTFFFFVVPFIVFLITTMYIMSRYSSMQFELSVNPTHHELNTMVRFMLLKDGEIFMQQITHEGGALGIWDNPIVKTIPFTETLTDKEAARILREIIDTDKFMLRRLFVTNTMSHNAFHFMAILDDDTEINEAGEWFSIYQIDQMMKAGMVNRPLAYEIHRIVTITMAWKTYDKNGKRLYPIKNYRPTFRLTDFKDWDVDYSDVNWLAVAQNNEDKPLFKLRRFWRKHISNVE